MKEITNEIKDIDMNEVSSAGFKEYFGGKSIGFFDIETLGLSPETAKIILSGFLIYHPREDRFEQLQIFAETPGEESTLLLRTIEELAKLDVVVTYNGLSFDIPFVRRRADLEGIAVPYIPWHLDLYRLVKKHSSLGDLLPNLKQNTLENYMGLWALREDEIDGAQSINMYYDFCSGDKSAGEKVLLHNRDDILQLGRLLGVTKKIDMDKALNEYGFPAGDYSIDTVDMHVKKHHLLITGTQLGEPMEWISFDETVPFEFNSMARSFCIKIPLHERKGVVFADLCEVGFTPDDIAQMQGEGLEENCLVLQTSEGRRYGACNRFARDLLERIVREWIISN